MRPTVVLVLGLFASVLTALLVYRAVGRPAAPASQALPATAINPVVVAAVDLPIGSVIEDRHLRTIGWPAGAMPANAYASPETVSGRVTTVRVVANEPITADKLAPIGTHGILPLVIEPGMRAVTVKVNEVTAVGGFIVPGSRVDVLLTADVHTQAEVPTGSAGRTDVAAVSEHRTRTLLQNVTVLALGQVIEASDPHPPNNLTTATLLATPDQGELLALAAAEGSLQLVLRGFSDNQTTTSPGKGSGDLFAIAARSPAAVPGSANQVELIRGAERVVLSF